MQRSVCRIGISCPETAAWTTSKIHPVLERAEKNHLDEKVLEMYKRALETVEADRIRCLQVIDSGTTGLDGK